MEHLGAVHGLNCLVPFWPRGGLLFIGFLISCAGAAAAATSATVDFGRTLRPWDGFGVTYMEASRTPDYRARPQDVGGLGTLSANDRRRIIDLVFGDNGLKPGIVKMFLDPFHEGYSKSGNDNASPHDLNLAGYDHTTTTGSMRYFAREGLALTRARGEDLTFFCTLYGPAPWMTLQKQVRARDLDPAEKAECAEYMISWAKYLRDVERLPVKYISLHNEGELPNRWPKDGSGFVSGTTLQDQGDYNLHSPPALVVDFLRFMRAMLDRQGMTEVGLTTGEPTNWKKLIPYADALEQDEAARKNLALIMSHGFANDYSSVAVDRLRDRNPALHAWVTSTKWVKHNTTGPSDVWFVEDLRRHIYEAKVNGIVPRAILQRLSENPGTSNPVTGIHVNDSGQYEVQPGYYYFKQLCRAGQPGMSVVEVSPSSDGVNLIGFGRNGTAHPDAFVVINTTADERNVQINVLGSPARTFAAFRTSPKEQYVSVGKFPLRDTAVHYAAPAGSVTTFYAEQTGVTPKRVSTSSSATETPAEPGRPRLWGNVLFVDLAVGETHRYLGKTITLLALDGQICRVDVNGTVRMLTVARRQVPEIIEGVRVFIADNRNVKAVTTDRLNPLVHGATTRDALLALSDPSKPMMDPARFTFPISRADGYQWTMEEASHMFAFRTPTVSHQGIDLGVPGERGTPMHPAVAIEDGIVRWIEFEKNDPRQKCLLMESVSQPGIYYLYQHLSAKDVFVAANQTVKKGEKLASIWGTSPSGANYPGWKHLHFSVIGYGPVPTEPEKYRFLLNSFPALWELWHGQNVPPPKLWANGTWPMGRRHIDTNRSRLNAYDDVVGYGWRLGTWCPAESVEPATEIAIPKNARLRKTLWPGTAAAATNPELYYDFEIAVANGRYRVKALVGDETFPSWQKVNFEGVDAGVYNQDKGSYTWTPEKTVVVSDGKLTVRFELKDGITAAGVSELVFVRASE